VIKRWIVLVALVTAPVFLTACTRAADTDRDKTDIRQLVEKYLQSVKTADVTLASEVWLQSPDISMVTPFGRFQGWESVRDGVYVNVLQKAFVERNLEPHNLAIRVSGQCCVGGIRLDLHGEAAKWTALHVEGMGEPRVPKD
jgi:hypothetical protein